mmetsp:Transcript_16808/g.24875  ORF Transcript_16808/g.24875 Transcript_16808/m.24875 type:complete len:86 (-) Transcript_16808:1074-1331(-)
MSLLDTLLYDTTLYRQCKTRIRKLESVAKIVGDLGYVLLESGITLFGTDDGSFLSPKWATILSEWLARAFSMLGHFSPTNRNIEE